MLTSVHSLKVYIDTGYTDMRKSINGLSILVADKLELDPLSGHLFAFCNRRRDITKILYWDRNGFCLFQKRLEKNKFQWPETTRGVVDNHSAPPVKQSKFSSSFTFHEKAPANEIKKNYIIAGLGGWSAGTA